MFLLEGHNNVLRLDCKFVSTECGRPVLCGNVSDNSLMVHDTHNVFLFNPQDVNDNSSVKL